MIKKRVMKNSNEKSIIHVYTDGACEPNPGEGGWAFCISENEFRSGYHPSTTNNRMELFAVIEAIDYVKENYPGSDMLIHSDSQYCVKGFNEWSLSWKKRGWKKKGGIKNLDLWQYLDTVRDGVTLKWVKGHSGIPLNELADKHSVLEIMKNGK